MSGTFRPGPDAGGGVPAYDGAPARGTHVRRTAPAYAHDEAPAYGSGRQRCAHDPRAHMY
ncbi:hypothetical protein [Streptomyces sp. 8L]|uniref:hypothetical protein n=1 Tax=Streptomyces sp. 8L TaxID=2877242 RepID=UPI001CD507CF|nr:hypothetical protein [Streptomyces sp. 8L]MCA1217050.1 hypothetical protein [Streptomyces sp. 8L]